MDKLSEEELKAIWNLTRQGIDLEELEKAAGEIQEILKPVFKLYAKNVQIYLKYKSEED
jgi:Asp-tRNA(Asn)/Glu-tRNA(Gln) amidotransferase C subunit